LRSVVSPCAPLEGQRENAGGRAEGIDQVLTDLEVVMSKLRQANLLFDAAAWEQIRKMNDQVKAQGKHDPELLVMFKPLLEFFARGPREPAPAPQETAAR
jgi:hypothetical protein